MINRVLLYNSGGGVGDALQILPLINVLKKEFNSANFYYLCAHENHFNSTLVDFNNKIETLNLGIKYFGFRWWHSLIIKNRIKKYDVKKFDLIIDLQSKIRNSLLLKMIPHEHFISSCLNFKFSNPKINVKKEKKINNKILKAINYVYQKEFKLVDFDLNKIDKKFFSESEKLLPRNNYVGFSITQGNVYRKKEWPLNKIIDTCNRIKEKNKIPVFLIEKKNVELKKKISNLLPEALFPEHETNIISPALVTCLGTRLEFAITIDNGVMHMLSLAKVPIISLFGPTDSDKFAPEYKNSVSLDSKKLYNTKDLSAITVEDVLTAAKQFVNF